MYTVFVGTCISRQGLDGKGGVHTPPFPFKIIIMSIMYVLSVLYVVFDFVTHDVIQKVGPRP